MPTLAHYLALLQASPAITLIALILGVIVLAVVLSRLFIRKPSDNGLVYTWQKYPRK